MRALVYSVHNFDRPFLEKAAQHHYMHFTELALNTDTAHLAKGFDAISLFSNDDGSSAVLQILHHYGIKFIALRSAGFDHVDIEAAKSLGIKVGRVPEYSPYAIAEHAVAMLLALNRKLFEARELMRLQDFRLDGLTGFDIHGKTVGIVGTGKIGIAFARIMKGFGTRLLANDPVLNPHAPELEIEYVSLQELLMRCDIVSLHCPLNSSTYHLLGKNEFALMKRNAILINTARGAVIDTEALIHALMHKQIAGACLDVYEREKGLFFYDHRTSVLTDPHFMILKGMKNVILTGHQAFLTAEALEAIAHITAQNLTEWEIHGKSANDLN
ncbi:MAG: 2-hydroxyacid dehydrogenase [Chitinophagales bacterium]|nr:2-hydroxyacid dehydrogenase [Chitinophagales bacterium]